MKRPARRAALAAVTLALAACKLAGPAIPGSPTPVPALSPAQVLEIAHARAKRLRTLRAAFSAVVSPAQHRFVGALLVAKPDRFRLRLMLPIGLTVFDYLCIGPQRWVSSPAGDRPSAAGADASLARFDLAALFLRQSGPRDCRCHDDASSAVSCRCADPFLLPGAVTRLLTIRRDGTIASETILADGQSRLRAEYDDYRPVDAVLLPFQIRLAYANPDGTERHMTIGVDRYELNPSLDEALFAPPADARPLAPAP